MKATVRMANIDIEVEAETQRDLFREVARAVEIFGESKCGLCGCEAIVPVWRNVQNGKKAFEYAEMRCTNAACRATLSYGMAMEGGGMFPKRKLDKDGKPDNESGTWGGGHNGWTKYRGEPSSA